MDRTRAAPGSSDTRKNKPMKVYHELQKDMLGRIVDYNASHALPPSMTRGAALFTKVGTLNAAMADHAGGQIFGFGGYRAGATERRILAADLRTVLLDMAATARGLEPAHPGMADQFRLGRQAQSHQQLLATASAFLTALEAAPVKLLFTERSFPADLDVQLTAKIAAVTAAVSRKSTGRQGQKQGTASLDSLSREINATMRELRPLMVKYLRDNDPTLLPVWKAAARVYRVPAAAPEPPAGGEGSGGTTPPVGS